MGDGNTATSPYPSARIPTLDLIRGIAVLGILTINIGGFSGPLVSTYSPNLPIPVGILDQATFAFNFLVFEGKMRALFTLLFGAGIALFSEYAHQSSRDADILQLRRLGWLLVFGFAHYILLWWGDILFIYGACGIVALLLRPLSNKSLLIIAFTILGAGCVWGFLDAIDSVVAETAVRHHTANPAQIKLLPEHFDLFAKWTRQDFQEAQLSFFQLAKVKLTERPLWLVQMTGGLFTETIPLILIGIVLYRRGFFQESTIHKRFMHNVICSLGVGLTLTALYLGWAAQHHFPLMAMSAALSAGMTIPHLLIAYGYTGLLVHFSPRISITRLGQRLIAAGQMAFSNYILMSVIMTSIFYGWGLGWFGHFGPLAQWGFIILGWIIMLAWGKPWLRHFRRGPLEWLWRCLIEHRRISNLR